MKKCLLFFGIFVVMTVAYAAGPAKGQQLFSFTTSVLHSDSDRWKGYVFVIPLDKREKGNQVRKTGNWEFIGMNDQAPRCEAGKLQACQLVVDENDTYVSASGERKLKAGVRIVARKAKDVWFVSKYVSPGARPFEIRNEEDEK